MPPELARIQRWFFDLATAPEPVATAAEKLGARDSEAVPLTGWIAAAGAEIAAERLGRYADMYFARLFDVLCDDFEAVFNAVGRERFLPLVREYLTAHPSDDPSVRWVGRRFPEFLETHALLGKFPWLADLARLEWLRYEVFDREDAPAIGPETLGVVAPEAWAGLRFTFIPALRVARFAHPVTRYWKPLVSDGSFAQIAVGKEAQANWKPLVSDGSFAPESGAVTALIWRKGFEMWHREMDEAETRLLEKARAGRSFGALCEALADDGVEIEEAAQRAASLLARWVADGLLSGVRVSE